MSNREQPTVHPNPRHPSNHPNNQSNRGQSTAHPDPRHPSNLPHPNLPPSHPRNNPNNQSNQEQSTVNYARLNPLDPRHPHHPSNLRHPHLDPRDRRNHPRYAGATTGATDPHAFDPISINVPETGMRDNPEIKVLQYGDKKIILAPDGIFIISAGTTVSLNDEGVTIISDNDIRLQADGKIILGASEINITAIEGIDLKNESANIEIDEDVVIEGEEVKAN